jgi:drug/metabolite transporter (DMT)-like permease
MLLVLGASQGASYLFIRVAVRELSPPALMEIRLLFAAPILVVYCLARGRGRELRTSWRDGLVVGTFRAAIPFTLIAWGERHVDSGVTGVANGLLTYVTPVFALVLGAWFLEEQTTLPKLAGLTLIIAGVALGAGVGVTSRSARLAQGA